jgi:hypothetical protein
VKPGACVRYCCNYVNASGHRDTQIDPPKNLACAFIPLLHFHTFLTFCAGLLSQNCPWVLPAASMTANAFYTLLVCTLAANLTSVRADSQGAIGDASVVKVSRDRYCAIVQTVFCICFPFKIRSISCTFSGMIWSYVTSRYRHRSERHCCNLASALPPVA